MTRRVKFLAIAGITSGSAVLLLIFARYGYPVILEASHHFCPAAVNLAQGNGLINPVSQLAPLDPLGLSRFLWYPPLLQLVLSTIMWKPTGPNLLIAIAIVNTGTLLLSTLAFCGAARRGIKPWNLLSMAIILLGVMSMCSLFSFYLWGRPEILATFLLAGGTALYFWTEGRVLVVGLTVLLGLMGATHPTATILSALWVAIALGLKFPRPFPWKKLLACYIAAAAICLIALSWSPHSIGDTLAGIRMHSRIAVPLRVSAVTWDSLYAIFIARAQYPLIGILFIFAPIVGFVLLRKRLSSLPAPTRLLVGAAAFLMVGFAFFMVFAETRREYNAIWMLPLMICLLIVALDEWPLWAVKTISLITLVGISTGFLRSLALFPFYMRDGVSLQEARRQFERFRSAQPADTTYRISYSMWLLSDQYAPMRILDTPQRAAREVYVIQQNYMGPAFIKPPAIPGLVLRENLFQSQVPRLFGRRLASTMPGYGFAIYTVEPNYQGPPFGRESFY